MALYVFVNCSMTRVGAGSLAYLYLLGKVLMYLRIWDDCSRISMIVGLTSFAYLRSLGESFLILIDFMIKLGSGSDLSK